MGYDLKADGDEEPDAGIQGGWVLMTEMYRCRDCGSLMNGEEYMLHPSDHWVIKVRVENISGDKKEVKSYAKEGLYY